MRIGVAIMGKTSKLIEQETDTHTVSRVFCCLYFHESPLSCRTPNDTPAKAKTKLETHRHSIQKGLQRPSIFHCRTGKKRVASRTGPKAIGTESVQGTNGEGTVGWRRDEDSGVARAS